MILLLDAGNTRIKWGIPQPDAQPGAWLASGSLTHAEAGALAGVLAAHPGVRRIVGSNVAGAALGMALGAAAAQHGLSIEWRIASAACAGVRNAYSTPQQLGADRWAALIGARLLHRGPCLVVCAGTATTADLLDADGLFRGGIILPGLDLMLRALAGNTAQLPLADGHHQPFPRNTADAIVSGCLNAQAGAVERMFEPIAGEAHACCLLAGGAAARLAPLLRLPLRQVDNLVLLGLAGMARDTPEGPAMG